MSVSTEVQRTLVKSPPELWAELSDPDALSRHLGELGEIRVTCAEPETKVEWEAEGASGVVRLKASGWGTKVTLSVTREAPMPVEASEAEVPSESEPPPVAVEGERVAPYAADPDPEPTAAPAPEPTAVVSEPITKPEPIAEPEPEPIVEPEPIAQPASVAQPASAAVAESERIAPAEPEPQPGFFARLFRRRRAKLVEVVEPEPACPRTVEIVALAAPEPIYPARPVEPEPEPKATEPATDLASELVAVEAQMAEQATELLTSVLDRLGAAHHRPFSRG